MTDYRAIAETETDPNAPVISALMKALARNPVALAEGAAGAPRIATTAILSVADSYLGTLSATLSSSPAGLTGLGEIKRLRVCGTASNPSGATISLQVSFSADGGATWGGWSSLQSFSSGQSREFGEMSVDMLTGACASPNGWTAGGSGGPFDAIRYRMSGSNGSFSLMVHGIEGRG